MAIPQPSAPPPSLRQPSAAAPPAHAPPQTAAASQNRLTAVAANNCRLRAVAERLELHFRGGISLGPSDLLHLVFALARGIDYALSNNDIPGIADRLPSLIKQVYQSQNDPLLRSAIMVLMISARSACKNKWFLTPDINELLSIANELCSSFCMSASDTIVGNAEDTISKIMPRFYPQLQFCSLLVSFEAKPGYDILMADFHVPRNIPADERIYLLVAQTDDLETSSCIISPQHVSFLVNGKGVERRTNVLMDTGPQLPTDITKMLKYGTNIIQAIGYFSGNYIIVIAFMSKITTPYATRLEDYAHPVIEKCVSDSDIIEGPSRITLNCPISFKRIKTPVKGHLCKHRQCLDYDNFMEMNSRKPSWRCPCCNTPTSCIDLRIDQKMVKILHEVGEDVTDIVIFADGSWKEFVTHNESINQVHKGRSGQRETSTENRRSTSADIVDLTMEEDYTSDVAKSSEEVVPFHRSADRAENGSCELEDRKPFRDIEGLPIPLHASGASVASTSMCTQAAAYHTENGIWPRNLPSISSSISVRMSGADVNALGTLESLVPNVVLNRIQTDVVSPALNQSPTGFEFSQPTLNFQQVPQVTQLAENMQLQSLLVGGSVSANEAGRPPVPRHVSRTPIAVQALPAQTQTQTPNSSRRMQTAIASGLSSISGEMQISELSRSSNVASASLQLHSMAQQKHHHTNSALQQVVGPPTPNLINIQAPQGQPRGVDAFRAIVHSPSEHRHPHQLLYQRTHYFANPSSALQPSRIPSSQVQQASYTPAYGGATSAGTGHSILLSAQCTAQATTWQMGAARTPPTARLLSMPTLAGTGGALPSSTSVGLPELYNEQNWRPAGRMRGSLTGSAYTAALSQYLVTPQPARFRSPPFSVTATTDSLPVFNVDTLGVLGSMVQKANMGHADAGNPSTSLYDIFDTNE